MGGRPTKLTPKVRATILAAVRGGAFRETAAAKAGIGKTTLYDWIARGNAGEAPFLAFVRDLEESEAEAEGQLLEYHREAVDIARKMGDPRGIAAALRSIEWRLERRYQDRWGRKEKREVDAKLEATMAATVRHGVEGLSHEELASAAKEAFRVMADAAGEAA